MLKEGSRESDRLAAQKLADLYSNLEEDIAKETDEVREKSGKLIFLDNQREQTSRSRRFARNLRGSLYRDKIKAP